MSPTTAADLPAVVRLRLAVLFLMSWLSLTAAQALLLASDRLTTRARLRLTLGAGS